MEQPAKKQLVNRLNRILGQIESVRDNLSQRTVSEEDCVNTITQVKAANNALKKFAEAYLQNYLQDCLEQSLEKAVFEATKKDDFIFPVQLRKIKKNLEAVIHSTFSL